jgi:hypothetical protein
VTFGDLIKAVSPAIISLARAAGEGAKQINQLEQGSWTQRLRAVSFLSGGWITDIASKAAGRGVFQAISGQPMAPAANGGSNVITAPTRGFESIEASYDRIMEASAKIDIGERQLHELQQIREGVNRLVGEGVALGKVGVPRPAIGN